MLFGVPYIELNSQAYVTVALRGYENARDKTKLSFLYRVATGEESSTSQGPDAALAATLHCNPEYSNSNRR